MHRHLIALTILASSLTSLVSAEGTLYYDAPTGEVFFDIDLPDDRFITFDIRSEAGLLMPENFIRLGDPTILFFTSNNYIADNAGLGTFKPDGLYGIGSIYPPNVSESDFLADVTSTWGGVGDLELTPFATSFTRPTGVPRNDLSLPNLSEAWASSAELIYDATTGDVVLDTPGYLSVVDLRSDDSAFDTPSIPWADERFVSHFDPDSLSIVGLLEPGQYSIESLLPPGLGQTELLNSLSSASFRGAAGVGATQFDLETDSIAMSIIHVPEPTTALLICWIPILFQDVIRRNLVRITACNRLR